MNNTTRLWNASNGNSIGEPMKHENRVLRTSWKSNGEIVRVRNRFVFLRFVAMRDGLQIHFQFQLVSRDHQFK
jgi:hypothetical protein